MNNHSLFENNGNILLKAFIKDSNFNEICEKLKKDVLIELKNIDKKKNRRVFDGKPCCSY
jgi:hypothetical protein